MRRQYAVVEAAIRGTFHAEYYKLKQTWRKCCVMMTSASKLLLVMSIDMMPLELTNARLHAVSGFT